MAHRRRVWFGANSSDRPEVTYELASFMHVHIWWDFVLKERKQKTKIMSFRHSALHVHTLYKTRSYATHIFIVFISFFFSFLYPRHWAHWNGRLVHCFRACRSSIPSLRGRRQIPETKPLQAKKYTESNTNNHSNDIDDDDNDNDKTTIILAHKIVYNWSLYCDFGWLFVVGLSAIDSRLFACCWLFIFRYLRIFIAFYYYFNIIVIILWAKSFWYFSIVCSLWLWYACGVSVHLCAVCRQTIRPYSPYMHITCVYICSIVPWKQ